MRMLAAAAVLLAATAPGVALADTTAFPASSFPERPAVFDAPMPLDPAPAADLPTAEQLTGILDNLVDPEVPDGAKSALVAGGLQRHQANVLDRKLRRAGRRDVAPLTFTAANIAPAGPDAATADVTVTGAELPSPITRTVTFTNQNGWVLSQEAADELIEGVVGRLPG